MVQKFSLLLIVSLLLSGCDEEGLNPNEFQEPGFSGTITFVGSIPPRDSIDDLRVVAVPYYPVDTTVADLIDKILNKQIIPFSGSLSDQVEPNTTIRYEMFVKPQTYYYIAVAQLYGANIFQDWRVVSIYGHTPTHNDPLPITIIDGELKENINFTVDFYNLPPQPFKVP
ncbi:MAG: hypothetical protein HYV29_13190 [Ignavibacteriales bacterium]|nr:hypothetical protein [Ignavibacteriales bacterium]